MVYTSNKREGQPGFSFPEGCPKGRKRAQRVGPRDIPRGKKTQAVPTSCWRYVILFQVVLSSRESMIVYFSYSPGLAGGVWKIHYHTFPVQPGEYGKVIRQPEKEWHTSNKRLGQPGFSFPSGHPSGKENPGCPSLLLEVYTILAC